MVHTVEMARVDPVERVLNLLTLLHESPRPLSRAEIVQHMAQGSTPYPESDDALHQAFSGDRRTLATVLGVAIHQRVRSGTDAGQTEYWIDRADAHLPELDLDPQERLVLALALGAVRRTVPWAGEALLKLGRGWDDAVSAIAPIDIAIEVPDAVVTLLDAARSGAVVEVDTPFGRREIEPWAVVLTAGAWSVVGPGSDGEPEMVRVGASCDPAIRPDRARTWPTRSLSSDEIAAALGAAPGSGPVARVRVDGTTAVRAMLSGQVIGPSIQVEDPAGDDVWLDVTVADRDRFRRWVLALGEHAVVESPAELRDEIVELLGRIVTTAPSGRPAPPRPARAGRRRGPEPASARLHRLVSIVPWLYRQGSIPVAEIADRIGASPGQVVRDLTLASMCGVPPYTADALFGFWVEPDPETDEPVVHVLHPNLLTEPVRLTARQAATVAVALSALAALPGTDQQVAERLRSHLEGALGAVDVRVQLDDPPHLDAVRRAVERHERLHVRYVDLDDDVTDRVVDPLKLFVDRGNVYVYADDHLRGAERVFRVDRIVEVVPTGERFEPRPVVAPAGTTWTWMVPDRDVVVRLPPGSEWVLDRYATTASVVEDDGSIVAWLSVVSVEWLTTLLLRCGPGAEVVEPEDLADVHRARARALLSRYA